MFLYEDYWHFGHEKKNHHSVELPKILSMVPGIE